VHSKILLQNSLSPPVCITCFRLISLESEEACLISVDLKENLFAPKDNFGGLSSLQHVHDLFFDVTKDVNGLIEEAKFLLEA
jgi:hypothetical protein